MQTLIVAFLNASKHKCVTNEENSIFIVHAILQKSYKIKTFAAFALANGNVTGLSVSALCHMWQKILSHPPPRTHGLGHIPILSRDLSFQSALSKILAYTY